MKKRIFKISKWFAGITLSLFLLISLVLYFFKDDIINAVVSEMNSHLKGKVQVAEVDLAFWGSFPNLSVDFNNVFIQDSYEQSSNLDTLLYSKKIRLKFNPMDLWRENYTVKSVEILNGTLKMKVNDEGVVNYDIFKESTDSTESKTFDVNLEAVQFENFGYAYINEATNQEYRTLINEMSLEGAFKSSVFTTKAQADLQIISARSGEVTLISNQPAKLNVSVNVNKDSSTVSIPESVIHISDLPFNFSGEVNDGGFYFNLNGKNLSIKDAANRLAMSQTNEVDRFEGQGVLKFNLDISKQAGNSNPLQVTCDFGVNNGNLRIPSSSIALNKLKLEGFYTNAEGKKKEKLELKNISFRTKGGPFKGELLLTNFDSPVFKGNANGLIDLAVLHALFSIPKVEKMQGTINLNSNFIVQGNSKEDETMDYDIKKLEGSVKFNDVLTKLTDDKRIFESIDGLVYLRNNEAGIDNVSLKIGKSDFLVKGVFKEVVDYFKGTGNLIANIDVTSKNISMQDLGTDSKESKIKKARTFILPNNIDGKMYLDVTKLTYENHLFEQIQGNMTISGRTIHFPRVALVNGGADVRGSLTIEERTPEIFYISSQLVSKNINFTKLFREWENFNQEVITSKNIEGVAQANITFEAPFDMRGGIISNAIRAQISIQIDNGRLKNVETFAAIIESLRTSSLKTILGKENINAFGKKLGDLRFDQLKNTIIIKNSVLTIPSMSINSSALNIEASGRHTFDNKIDYRFGFRFRDLKKKQESEFGEIIDDGSGFRVFMKMYGDLDTPTIEWDRESRKELAKKNREEEKQNVKSILKSEFGLFKNDTTVKQYVKEVVPKEELIIEFDPVKSIDTIIENKEPKKDTKMNRWLEKMKKQAEAEKKEEFIIE
ncbi:MAG: hypothetical protein COA33_010950 [Fluviicola sp.]|nr:hypothetical protein [Fluviicola sp.]